MEMYHGDDEQEYTSLFYRPNDEPLIQGFMSREDYGGYDPEFLKEEFRKANENQKKLAIDHDLIRLETIRFFVSTIPNDQDLGAKVREFINISNQK